MGVLEWTIPVIGLTLGQSALIGGGVGAAASAAGSVWSGISAYQEADYNSKIAAANADQERLNADAARAQAAAEAANQRAQTDAEAALLRKKNSAVLAQNRANSGLLGFDNTGSNLLVEIDNAENAEFDARETIRQGRYSEDLINYQGQLNAYGHTQKANVFDAQAKQQKALKSSAIFGSAINGTAGAASGFFSGAGAGASLFKALH
ncbi:MAG: hypothetical protein PHI35_03325 [Victivallaceae bacterium]|nr:hypothetical protein [Victivallaceae bacterium]